MSTFLFLVQGEGRGHLTQALSLRQMLHQAGHRVVAMAVGTAQGRTLPTFFTEACDCPLLTFRSPCLQYNPTHHTLDLWRTIGLQVPKALRYAQSAKQVQELVTHHQPDVVVNFYEVVGGLWKALYSSPVPMVCVGHQYLFLHPSFRFPPNQRLQRWLVNLNTRLTAIGAKRLLALSFDELPSSGKIVVVPPLLRKEVTSYAVSTQEGYWLAYATLPQLAEDLIAWHREHPNVQIHCFWNHPEHATEWHLHDGRLVFHPIDGAKFLDYMKHCSGLITTAGFESVCEAMYWDKPVMMIPVPNHFEQTCNAQDAVRVGAGLQAKSFANLDDFEQYVPQHQSIGLVFKAWQQQSTRLFVETLAAVAPQRTMYVRLRQTKIRLLEWLRPLGV
ncbi:MAG: glycosyltransferase family protein [Spirosomataceae bacterium]